MIKCSRVWWMGLAFVIAAAPVSSALAVPTAEDIKLLSTPDGVEFGVWGGRQGEPAPTLIILSGNIVDSFVKPNFLKIGEALAPRGYLCVSIDLPCHATQAKKGFSGLVGWGKRAAAGDDFVAEFNGRMSSVIDHLIAQGLTDPDRIAATGTSRGGFLAIRYMAFDKRVKCAAGYSPVTDLRRLKEFDVARGVPGVDAMSLEAYVPALVGRPVFIVIGDRDERVGTDAAIRFAQRLSAAAVEADVPSDVALHVLSEPRGHSTPRATNELAAPWVEGVLNRQSESAPADAGASQPQGGPLP